MEINQRQKKIIRWIVKRYIQTQKPVSSKMIAKRCSLGIGAPMIRIELRRLEEKGYLFQPHTSAGRIPMEKAYRFFVEEILKEKRKKDKEKQLLKEQLKRVIFQKNTDILGLCMNLVDFLASASSSLVLAQLLEKRICLKEGWQWLIREKEVQEEGGREELIDLLDLFEREMEKMKTESEIKIFIGGEDEFADFSRFSVLVSSFHLPFKEKGIISLIGPKRMAYEKNIKLFQALKEVLEENQ